MVAIFDLDGTLTKKDTFIPFLLKILKNKPIRLFRASILPFFVVVYFLKIIDNHKLKQIFLWAFLGGAKIESISNLTREFTDELINNGMNSVGMKFLRRHQDRGDRVIIATASFGFYAGLLANKMGVTEIVCTEAEVISGKFTGRIDGLNCHGEEKLKRVKTHLGNIPPEDIAAFSDHISDIPVLKWAGKGYLVTPKRSCLKDLKSKTFDILV